MNILARGCITMLLEDAFLLQINSLDARSKPKMDGWMRTIVKGESKRVTEKVKVGYHFVVVVVKFDFSIKEQSVNED